MTVILICGLPGTGKTTIAENLGKKINAQVLSTDKIRKEIIPQPTYSSKEKFLVYNVMLVIAKYLNKAGLSCVLDATFSQQKFREQVKKKLGISEKELHIVECICPEKEVLLRLQKRKDDYSDADLKVYQKMKKIYEPVKSRHITIDTSKDIKENVNKIIKEIVK